jgi:asparagine synthase (glutamine-hydrolysing)
MPGIAGFQGTAGTQSGDALMTALVQALGVEDGYKVDCFSSPNLGLARVHLGLVDSQPQPLWSADRSIALVMTGEIFSWDGLELKEPLTGKEQNFSNAALLLAAYTQYGEEFVDHVNGTFAAAIWNATEQTLLLVADHVASCPLYYAHVNSMLVFGSGARVVAQVPGLPRAVNKAAVAEMVAFEHLYGDKTLFNGVQFLLPGTILRFRDGTISQSRYIDFQYPDEYQLEDEASYVEKLAWYTRQAVARQARGPVPLGVLLTGGLDSRFILGMLVGHDVDIRTITFGIPGCDDEVSARALAHVLHLPHRFVALAPDYLTHYADKGVYLTDGQKNVVHFNVLGALETTVQEAKVLYKGFLGGTIHGDVVLRERLAPVRQEVIFDQVFKARNRIFKEDQLQQLYTDAMYRDVCDVPRQTLRTSLARSRSTWLVDQFSYLDMYEGDVRFTVMGVELARSQALVRAPFADKELLHFTRSVPPGYRIDKTYYRKAIIQAFPQLAKVVYSGTHRPVTDGCFRDVQIRTGELTRYWLRNHGARWVQPQQSHPYTDYGGWFRHELRPWVEAALLSPQSLDRGYFAPAYIRNVVAEHMGGCDHTRRIGLLLTLELWHRQFMD